MKHVAAVLLAFLGVTPLAATQPKQDLVRAELLADTSAVKPGEPFTVGVRLTVEPGWHVYWLNPGDSGRATSVTLDVPQGFVAGPVRYPVPIQFEQPGDLVGYGYEREVLLTAEVTPPADLADKEFTLTADVGWLACKDACVPGEATVSLTLPISDKAEPANRDVFREWAARLPVERDPAVAAATWEADAADRGTLTHVVKWNTIPKEVEFYPGASDVIEFQNIDVKTEAGQTRTTIKAQLWASESPERTGLSSLLVYTDEKGGRHGVPVEIPVGKLKPTLPGE